jgi:acyl-coenzyme A thioesterase PaaI-like protein
LQTSVSHYCPLEVFAGLDIFIEQGQPKVNRSGMQVAHQRLKRTLDEGEAMNPEGILAAEIMEILQTKFGDHIEDYKFPPPIFQLMKGEFIELDLQAGNLVTKFPILPSYMNPYGTMQGGMIAAAIDNTLGPLSVLVAPPNVTRLLELKYSKPISADLGHMLVQAQYKKREDRRLYFEANARSEDGDRLVRAKAVHWIVD